MVRDCYSGSRTSTMQGFCTPNDQCCREIYLISRLHVSYDKVIGAWNVGQGKPVHDVCLKKMSRTITMQAFISTATTVAEKWTLFLDSTWIFSTRHNILTKSVEREMKVKGTGSRCLLEEGLILTAITAAQKWTLFLDLT